MLCHVSVHRVLYPGYQRFFSRAAGIFGVGRRPTRLQGRKWCDCHESHLLCDLPKVLTDKSQVCAVELVLLEYFVSGDFVLESLFCVQRLWILNLFSANTELWASQFD